MYCIGDKDADARGDSIGLHPDCCRPLDSHPLATRGQEDCGVNRLERTPLLLAATVLMMILVQPVSGIARIWDLLLSASVSQGSSLGIPRSDLSALALWIAGSSSSSLGLSAVATLALSLLFCVFVLLSGFDLHCGPFVCIWCI